MKLSEIQNTWWFKLYIKFGPYYSAKGLKHNHTGALTFCDICWTILWGGIKACLANTLIFIMISALIIFASVCAYSGVVVVPLHILYLYTGSPFWAHAFHLMSLSGPKDKEVILSIIGCSTDVSILIIAFIFGVGRLKKALTKKKVGQIHKRGFISQAWYDFKTKSCTIVELDV